ncbi:uncharacterized protein PAC_04948 [Phialocephala subalpina]|uniref:DUF300-domain-containing protein n=1 Tax=Phialocephala subalpina TaxID=576137 RepID=A0A1L7WQL6_9HELO|nr:uncharacterized protein PAC_04948 [Phialocephala subalpina]
MSNSTCNTMQKDIMDVNNELPMAGNMTFHDIILITELACVIATFALSLYQIACHALNYRRPVEQKYILRILFMVPLYSVSMLLSTKFFPYSTYFILLSSTYASVAIASYFSLLCHYLAPDGDSKSLFSNIQPGPWQNYFPLPLRWLHDRFGGEKSFLRAMTCGVTWFNIITLGILQYCLLRCLTAIASVIAQPLGRYCASSLNPLYCHIWTLALNAISATIAMYCLDQFTWQMKDALRAHRPTLKLWCVKIVFAVSMYQNLILALITTAWIPSKSAVQATSKVAYADLRVGIPALMLCFELLFTSILHIHAFSWRVYGAEVQRKASYGGFLGYLAILDALNIFDLIRAFGSALRWLLKKEGGYETTDQTDNLGDSKINLLNDEKASFSLSTVAVEREVGFLEPITYLDPVHTGPEPFRDLE